MGRVQRWHECHMCGRKVRVNLTGRLRKHNTNPRHIGGRPCDGSDDLVVDRDGNPV